MKSATIDTKLPRIVAYWTGYEKLDFNPSEPAIPAYVQDVDVLILAFALVQGGTLQYTCASDETCLCNGPQYWTQEQIEEWLRAIKASYPEIKVLLSIGGWAFNDWASVTSAGDFASNVVGKLGEWSGLVDGVDIDYELGSGSTTSLPSSVSFHDVVSALIKEMDGTGSGSATLSLPYYGGSPWQPADLVDLSDNISFVSTMGYGQNTGDYDALLAAGYRAVKGISGDWTPSGVGPIFKNNNIKAGMFWNLCENKGSPPSAYIEALNASLPAS